MPAALTFAPSSGNITAKKTVVRVGVTGAAVNNASTFNADHSPSEDPYSYVIRFRLSGVDDKLSYVFNVNSEGEHEFNNFIFDEAGTWTVTLRDTSDDSQVATASVVVA